MQDTYRSNQGYKTPPKDDCKCKENDTVTQKTINDTRKQYCTSMDGAASDVYQWEENFSGLSTLVDRKQCLFIWTETNYQVFRNFEISTGTSLIQFNETIKDATAGYLKANKNVADSLKDVVKKLKDINEKLKALKLVAQNLKDCTGGCNCNQWAIITDDWSNCKGDKKDNSSSPRPKECEGVADKFKLLWDTPAILVDDSMDIYKASADIVGIQVFSNIGTLDGLQKNLYDNAKALDKHLQDTMKKDQDDVKKMQDDYVKSIQDLAKSKGTLYGKRGDFLGYYSTAAYFCCPDCDCLKDKSCKEKICGICDEVQKTFCDCPPPATSAS